MTNHDFKFSIKAPTTVNQVASMPFSFDEPFRVDQWFLAVPAIDAYADGDIQHVQISTNDQDNAADLLATSDKSVVGDGGFTASLLGTNGNLVFDDIKIRKELPNAPFIIEAGQQYINVLISGQDGAIASEVILRGHYVDDDKINLGSSKSPHNGVL